jgi:hypothetical protein
MIASVLIAGLTNMRIRGRKVTGINVPLKIHESVKQGKCFSMQMNYVKVPEVCFPDVPLSVVTA